MDPQVQKIVERRQSKRIEFKIRLVVKWLAPNKTPHEEATETKTVSAHGCLVSLRSPILEGADVTLVNPATGATRSAHVVWSGPDTEQHLNTVGIDLKEPDAAFWGPKYEEASTATGFSDSWVD